MRILVVGAGVIGCAVAHELASRGASVHVLDSRGVGQGATRASAGILAPQIEGQTPELRRLTSLSLSLYDDLIPRVEADSGRQVDYGRVGSVQIGIDEATLAAECRWLREAGFEHQVLDEETVRAIEPALSDGVGTGLVVPGHGYVAAGDLTLALEAAARARGATLEIATVLEIARDAHGPIVQTKDRTLRADAVVLASGAWPVHMGTLAGPVLRPIRGQLVHLRLDEPVISRVIWGPECYLVPWRDGSVLVGATVEDVGFDERATVEGVQALLAAATRLAPALARAHLVEVRVGLRPKGADEMPVIGRSPAMAGVFYTLAHYRNGVLLAPLTAVLLADLLLDGRERSELALVRPAGAVSS